MFILAQGTDSFSEPQNRPSIAAKPTLGARIVQGIAAVDRRLWSTLLPFSDGLLTLLAFLLAYWIRYRLQWFRAVDPVFQTDFRTYLPSALALVCIQYFALQFSGAYRRQRGRGWLEEVYAIASASAVGVSLLIPVHLIFQPLLFSRLIFLYTAILVTALLGLSRLVIRWAWLYLRRHGVGMDRAILIGAGDVGRMIMRNTVARPDFGIQLIGFLDDNPAKSNTDIGRFRALGSVDNFRDVLLTYHPDIVIICLPWQSHRTVLRLLHECERMQIGSRVVPDLFQMTKNQIEVEELNGIPLLSAREVSITGWNYFLKRLFDLVMGSLTTLIMLPVGGLVALAIRWDSDGPIFYRQIRIGKNGLPFHVYKFRSMVTNAEDRLCEMADLNEATGPLFKMRDDPRQTRVGHFLRKYSLDELPQLFNVLRGEMSLVGPRPNLPQEVEQYQAWHRKRLSVSPGMTGLWQVSGRSNLTFDEMVLLDIYYAENWNLLLDFNILLRTIPAVISRRGAY